jgi:hypothetical protein
MDKENAIYIYIYKITNVILFSFYKKKILSFAATQMNLENAMLNKMSQAQKDKYCMASLN